MAWVTPTVFVSGNVLTAAQMNIISGDLNESATAKASAAGQYFVSTAANTLIGRTPSSAAIDTAETTTSTTPVDLTTPGPAVTLTTGQRALVFIASNESNATSLLYAYMSYAVSGASTIAAQDNRSVSVRSGNAGAGNRATAVYLETALNAGSNTFTCKYWAPSGGTAAFSFRTIIVVAF